MKVKSRAEGEGAAVRIGELARRTGVSARMLRYYEEQGVLTPPRRASGYREYDERDVTTVGHVRTLSDAGLTLDTVRALLPCAHGEVMRLEPCPDLLASLDGELAGLDRRIETLRRSRDLLAGQLARTRQRLPA